MTDPAASDAVPPPVSRKKKTFAIVSTLVVISGVLLCLGAIATPKFIGFSCKAKQSEPKTNLSGLRTAQKAFFGEHGYYTTDLLSLNWKPDGTPIYVYGFAVPSTMSADPHVPGLDPTRRTTLDPRVSESGYSIAQMATVGGRTFTDEDFQQLAPTATATSSAYLAVAIGDVDTDSGEQLDVWTMGSVDGLVSVTNDCHD